MLLLDITFLWLDVMMVRKGLIDHISKFLVDRFFGFDSLGKKRSINSKLHLKDGIANLVMKEFEFFVNEQVRFYALYISFRKLGDSFPIS